MVWIFIIFNILIVILSILLLRDKKYCRCKGEKHYLHLKKLSLPRYLIIIEKLKNKINSSLSISKIIKDSEFDDSCKDKYVKVDIEICSTCGYKKMIFKVMEYDPLIGNYQENHKLKNEYILKNSAEYPHN